MEVSVVEADRDRARDLGLYPATVSRLGHDNTWIAGWAGIRSSHFNVIDAATTTSTMGRL